MSVGEKINNYINKQGINQSDISYKTGLTLNRLNLVLNKKQRLTFKEYELICGVLNVNTDKFIQPRKPGNKNNIS